MMKRSHSTWSPAFIQFPEMSALPSESKDDKVAFEPGTIDPLPTSTLPIPTSDPTPTPTPVIPAPTPPSASPPSSALTSDASVDKSSTPSAVSLPSRGGSAAGSRNSTTGTGEIPTPPMERDSSIASASGSSSSLSTLITPLIVSPSTTTNVTAISSPAPSPALQDSSPIDSLDMSPSPSPPSSTSHGAPTPRFEANDGSNLIVNYIPVAFPEEALRCLFAPFGTIIR